MSRLNLTYKSYGTYHPHSSPLSTRLWNSIYNQNKLVPVKETPQLIKVPPPCHLNERKFGLLLIDLTGAYDNIWHKGLLYKLLQTIPNQHLTRFTVLLIQDRYFTLGNLLSKLKAPSNKIWTKFLVTIVQVAPETKYGPGQT